MNKKEKEREEFESGISAWMEQFGSHWTIYRCTRTILNALKQQMYATKEYFDEIPTLGGFPFAGGYFMITPDDGESKLKKSDILDEMLKRFIQMIILAYPNDIEDNFSAYISLFTSYIQSLKLYEMLGEKEYKKDWESVKPSVFIRALESLSLSIIREKM